MSSIGDDGAETESAASNLSARAGASVHHAAIDENTSIDQAEDEAKESNIEDHDMDDDEDDDEDIRENRFIGPSRTWHNFTADERALAASLDQQRANDLSIHLYNAHALKRGVQDPDANSRVKSYHGKKRWIKTNEDESPPWYLETNWTAWPLQPENVPRKEEQFGVPLFDLEDDGVTYRMEEAWRPSADLEEEIQALILRKAKERIRGRQWEQSPGSHALNGKHQHASEVERETDESMEDGDNSVGGGTESVKDSHSTFSGLGEVDVLTDDVEASQILGPTVRHIISQIDDLLLGLHKSRMGHVSRVNSRSRSRPKGPGSRMSSQSARSVGLAKKQPSATTSKLNGQGRTKKVAKKRFLSPSDEDSNDEDTSVSEESTDEDVEEETSEYAAAAEPGSENTDEREAVKRPKRQRPLNPRDWSEVLGMASLVGWNPAVIDRAARRCSSLFGEGMQFVKGGGSEIVTYGPDMKPTKPSASEDMQEDFIIDDTDAREWLICPVPSCQRKGEPFEKDWRWREHMKRSHKYSKARIRRVEADLRSNLNGGNE